MAWWNGNPEPVNSVLPDPRGALPWMSTNMWMVTSLTCAITLEVALVGILWTKWVCQYGGAGRLVYVGAVEGIDPHSVYQLSQ